MTNTNTPLRSHWMRRALLASIAVALLVAIVFAMSGGISFEGLRGQRAALDALLAEHLLWALMLYVTAYALIVALSLPVSIYLTLLGGYLFGPMLGFGAAWLGAVTGATFIFLAARTTLGDMLRARAGPWLARFEAGFRDNGFNYLLALRLTPVMPFWILNLAPALLGVKLRDFVLATALGIIPVWFVLVSVGAGLHAAFAAGAALDPAAAVRELLFSPLTLGLLSGFIALALAPVIYKKLRKPS